MSEQEIEPVGKVVSKKSETKKPMTMPNQDHFEALMNQSSTQVGKVAQEADQGKVQGTSIIDEASKANSPILRYSELSPEKLIAQAQEVIGKIDNLKRDLQTPNLELKGSVQSLLKNKLEHIDENLKIALTKVGSDFPDLKVDGSTPIERFIGFLSKSQYQLDHLASDIELMQLSNKDISPGTMLAVQLKVGFVQQQIEFFTNLLNKALESTKTIMNVQI